MPRRDRSGTAQRATGSARSGRAYAVQHEDGPTVSNVGRSGGFGAHVERWLPSREVFRIAEQISDAIANRVDRLEFIVCSLYDLLVKVVLVH